MSSATGLTRRTLAFVHIRIHTASNNRCFKAALTWQHGTFTNNANGSLSLKPFAADGVVQVMDPCAATSVQQYAYNQ